jgi:hypothetical protein
VYEKSEGVKLVTVESHVKVRIVSPVEFPVDLRSGERKTKPGISKIEQFKNILKCRRPKN